MRVVTQLGMLALIGAMSSCATPFAKSLSGTVPTVGSAAQGARSGRPSQSSKNNFLYYEIAFGGVRRIRLSDGKLYRKGFSYAEGFGLAADTQHRIYQLWYLPDRYGGYSVFDEHQSLLKTVTLPTGIGAVSIAIDGSNQVYLLTENSSGYAIEIFDADAQGQAAPIRTIEGRRAGLGYGTTMAVDAQGYLYVAYATGSISVFAPGADGNVPPVRTISGALTQLVDPLAMTIGGDSNIYVANQTGSGYDIVVFPLTDSGNVAPLRTLNSTPYGTSIALDSTGQMYIGIGPTKHKPGFAIFAAGAAGEDQPIGFLGPADFGPGFYPGPTVLRFPWFLP